MADQKISELLAASALDGTELVPIVQGGVTKQTTIGDIVVFGTPLIVRPDSGSYALTGTDATLTASVPPILNTYSGAAAAFSFRKLRTAYAGSAVRIRRSSDNAETDIGFSGRDFDAAAAATHIGGGSGFIVTWYDQSGNGADATQATTGNQPLYVASGIGSKPCLSFVSNDLLATGTTAVPLNTTTPSLFAVLYMTVASQSYGRCVGFLANGQTSDSADANSNLFLYRISTSEAIASGDNSTQRSSVSVTYDTANVLATIYDGTNNKLYRDTIVGTTVACTTTFGVGSGNQLFLGNTSAVGNGMVGQCSEVILWGSNQTANLTAIDSDMGGYYGL